MQKIKLLVFLLISSTLFNACGGKAEPYTKEEIRKVHQIVKKHEALIGTGYWKHVKSIEVKTNSSNNPYYGFVMNNSYWNINDSNIRLNITDKYRSMQRVFEKQANLNKKIQISTY